MDDVEYQTAYSPWDLLPAPEPKTVAPPIGEFYEQVVKHLIPDIVRVMMNGMPIDLDKVEELEDTLDIVLKQVEDSLASNPLIREFQLKQFDRLKDDYIEEQQGKLKEPSHFLRVFKPKDMNHRSYFMHGFALDKGLDPPEDELPTGIPKWTAKDVKKHAEKYLVLSKLLDGTIKLDNLYVEKAMQKFAEDKAEIYNRRYHENIEMLPVELPKFNPASSLQKRELFDWLGIESEAVSKDTGLPKWDRDQVERVHKTTQDEDIIDFTQSFIDHSFSAIVKNNFVKAFYEYTTDGRLYGSMRLFGAKSFRLTSQNPNLLNLPSTKSIYSKPVKKCFVAPPGYVVLAIDYGALEDRVIASLSRDTNKCAVFTEGLDGHSLNAYGYFKEEVAEHMELSGDTNEDVKKMYELVESGHSALKSIRQKGKPATFGLSYGSFPAKVAATLKIPIEEAQSIFDRYHEELYGGITKYREGYVLPTAEKTGRMHLGMGCYIKTEKAGRDIRTLNNATCQFWSILTLLTINKMHKLIDDNDLAEEVQCISTIYDSIYYIVKADVDILKWVNDNLVGCMVQDFMEDQTIANEATAELGMNWAHMEQIPNGSSTEKIQEVLDSIGYKEE